MIEILWLLGGIAIGVILALLLVRSKRGDALLDRLLEWASGLIGHKEVRDELTEKFLDLLYDGEDRRSDNKGKEVKN